jgi:serine/threonine-protein kinase
MATFNNTEELGRGGFGVVHKCIRESDGLPFARKTLLLEDAACVKRFQREVRLVQKLKHPGIVKIISTHLDRPPYWYIMPLYERSLIQLLPELNGDRERALRLFASILQAIEYAHGENVIHRDLKPENILVYRYINK